MYRIFNRLSTLDGRLETGNAPLSEHDISRIVDQFGANVSLLHQGEIGDYNHASFEIVEYGIGADEAIDRFCQLIEGFPIDVREIWDNCRTRVFDIGYESGETPNHIQSEIKEHTIQRLCKVSASVRITIYSMRKELDAVTKV